MSKERWETLEGSFTLKNIPKQVVFFLEGPSPGVDLLIDSMEVSCNNDMNRHQVFNNYCCTLNYFSFVDYSLAALIFFSTSR